MIHCSAPATLMLMGEHAVLRGYPALVMAVSPRLHVYLSQRTDDLIRLESNLGQHITRLTALTITPPFTFVLALIKQFQGTLAHGFNLQIKSEFAATLGLGSSAAVLVAVSTALQRLTHPQEKLPHQAIFTTAMESLRTVQGQGSGADLAAALLGGVVYYQMEPRILEQLSTNLPLVAVYSGSKMATRKVIARVNTAEKEKPGVYQQYFAMIGNLVAEAKVALVNHDLTNLARLMRQNQTLMEQMNLANANIRHIIQRLQQDPGILAAKISGSGLGDCVIGLGVAQTASFPADHFEQNADMHTLALELSPQGVLVYD